MTDSGSINYTNKVILAPMVRIGTLPMRLLALDYGADLVYCEEIIDFKILTAKRVENELLGTVDFVLSDSTVVFRTCDKERGKVIFQLGTSDAKRALHAARKVEKDVAAIDINMGCPKEFSIKILSILVSNLSIPVTCKIRILPKLEETLSLVKLIESTGVAAVAVHARTQYERPRHANQNNIIKAIAETLKIPVIANGGSREITCYKDLEKFQKATGASSVMLARAPEWNCSIFRKEGKLPLPTVIKSYVKHCVTYGSLFTNVKYCILHMLHEDMDMGEAQAMLGVLSMDEICSIWNLMNYYEEITEKRQRKLEEIAQLQHVGEPEVKRRKTDDGKILVEVPVRYIKKDYPPAVTPKMKLFEWIKKNWLPLPHYDTVERPLDRCFNCVLTVGDRKYTTPFWEKSKQLTEQAAAISCLLTLQVHDGRKEGAGAETEALARKCHQLEKESILATTSSKNIGPETRDISSRIVSGIIDARNIFNSDGPLSQDQKDCKILAKAAASKRNSIEETSFQPNSSTHNFTERWHF